MAFRSLLLPFIAFTLTTATANTENSIGSEYDSSPSEVSIKIKKEEEDLESILSGVRTVQKKYQRPGSQLHWEEADSELEDDGQDAELHQDSRLRPQLPPGRGHPRQ